MDLTGQTAPKIELPRDGGETVKLSDIDGAVVLFFYPRADTPGCTTEAKGFTDAADEFAKHGVTVLGISKDPVKKQDKFRDKHELGVALLSDEEGDVCERYGTWVEKKMYGKTSMGIERSTFLIGADGTVVREWRKVKVPGHVDEVLEAAAAL
ncbi:Putative peroxiredoxin bcp [Rhodobacteraceae bacterium THAF1]|uniref:thioredoxin-dependent thiol peroxidase n=1 Tax=Palleronia sp. THAF1 TaxID=2587842 RepID=UPI000F3B2185|nr:thioredoxin-dependent thiol peroxidase [Palleronia sp. THAF1]QFU08968.1 Putative peroxiredoxin bcp [Palleronia sp. THAF1]VDC24293.1 Putative peroxiredoxin bcp [Rhodobacteraceae bacterium THAF1]